MPQVFLEVVRRHSSKLHPMRAAFRGDESALAARRSRDFSHDHILHITPVDQFHAREIRRLNNASG
jgi:hypothetical protein